MALQEVAERINTLTSVLQETTTLIQKLSALQPDSNLVENFANPTILENATIDEIRVDLAAEIGDSLRQLADDLEMLAMDIEDAAPPHAQSTRRNLSPETKAQLEDYNNLQAAQARLQEDLEIAHKRYRIAQLRAKHNLEAAAARERLEYLASLRAVALELEARDAAAAAASKEADKPVAPPPTLASLQATLFSHRRNASSRGGDKRTTGDDMLLTATSDVTASLKRTHEQLVTEVSRSRYAHETLEQSNAALRELGERYGGLDDLLKRSRGLLGTLLRSQKSDTWYLQTAVYVLFATLGWLVFRRLLWIPLVRMLWPLLRLTWAAFSLILSPLYPLVGGSSTSQTVASSSRTLRVMPSASDRAPPIPSGAPGAYVPVGQGGARYGAAPHGGSIVAEGTPVPTAPSDEDRQTQRNDGRDEQRQDAGTQQQQQQQQEQARRGDGQPLPVRDEATQPRNPKKRMFEDPPSGDGAQQRPHDEL